KTAAKVRVVFAGAGAAAIATAEHYVRLGVLREHILLIDRAGVVHGGRTDLDPYKARFAARTEARTLAEALKDADVFVGLSAAGIVKPEMIAAMGPKPIVFALANPDPEIEPEEVRRVRPDAIVATGRSDYPNQVNNVLGFPFIFRGALDARARGITPDMTMAATRALASLAREDVPDAVTRAYGIERLRFGPEYIIPKPFDPRVLLRVAPAVAWAAISSGVAGIVMDVDEYRAELEARLGRARAVMRGLTTRAAYEPQRIAFPDGEDQHVIRAAKILAEEHAAHPILLGRGAVIRRIAADVGIGLEDVEITEPADTGPGEAYVKALWDKRQRKGITLAEARALVRQPSYYACMMLDAGHCDALVSGADANYPDAIRPALETIGPAPDHPAVCSIYMMVLPHETYFFADCTVNIDPDATLLADIASATARFVTRMGIEPRVAMLSFSNFGSARHPASIKVADAVKLLHAREPTLIVDGEMQADTAVVTSLLRERYPFARLRTAANVLVFPDLNSANIAYKLLMRLGGAQAIGPILVGMARPVQVLQRGSDASDIVNIAVIAAVDAQERARHAVRPA
ncbi:MAG TPA: phosphate acyltransferase, partial [Gemmatimonadales bacterium]